MSFIGGGDRSEAGPGSENRAVDALVEQRLATRTDVIGTGTMACSRCDAPVSIGVQGRLLTDHLSCPFCGHQAAARDFLSVGAPTRPARVQIRLARVRHT